MDTQIEHKKRFTPKQIYGGVGVVLLIVLILYLFFRDTSSSMTVEKNRITIATIKEGEFNDYILDKSHMQKIEDISVTLKDGKLIILAKTYEDISLEAGLFEARADFFEQIYGIRPVLRVKRSV